MHSARYGQNSADVVLDIQEPDGMTRDELRQFIAGALAAADSFEIAGATVAWQPEQDLGEFREAVLTAASAMHWEEVRDWTERKNTAMSGMAALLWFEDHTPDPARELPSWRWVALQDSDHQSGYLRTLSAVRSELATEPSVAEALEWALRTFVTGPHEVIAYSKLPESTFRFCWEESRLRFYPAGMNASPRRVAAAAPCPHSARIWDCGVEPKKARRRA